MYYSPLRYPGGKGKLAPFMELMINKLNLQGGTYIEPFAGGAGIALDLLFNNLVNHIVINDYDKAVASFWKAVLTENDRFVDDIQNVSLNIDEWERQKNVLKLSNRYSYELGFATFYLNRTNRSGIINGGPIGGKLQAGEWKLDARFNRDALAERVLKIGKRKADISIYNKDVNSFIINYVPKYGNKTLIYFDPPYFEKGKQLYMNYFSLSDHERIERLIREHVSCNWMITYDNAPEIVRIYDGYNVKQYDLNYSVAKKRIASELIVFSTNGYCPTNDELEKEDICINLR
ncbi:DNA adenine methylase [bacterium 1XD21-13]|nr:DNA adenine methylase [bacterium 1XD21-13]